MYNILSIIKYFKIKSTYMEIYLTHKLYFQPVSAIKNKNMIHHKCYDSSVLNLLL